jgi:hypothetical protein
VYSQNNADKWKNNIRIKAGFKCPLWGGKQVLVQSKFAHISESQAAIKYIYLYT